MKRVFSTFSSNLYGDSQSFKGGGSYSANVFVKSNFRLLFWLLRLLAVVNSSPAHIFSTSSSVIASTPTYNPGVDNPVYNDAHRQNGFFISDENNDASDGGSFWVNLSISIILVLLGGIFAGLTLGLMGQDEVYLQVIQQSGDETERKQASSVLDLLKLGKHWVLVTLLLSNVITNETLPIVLDRCLGGGWPAVVTSTVAIVIFGEIIPQSICVRHGLAIGAYLAPFVRVLMYLMYPLAMPAARLLDYILGEDHGTIYKKAGLKSLVSLHRSMGAERLNQDEVTIISAVLDLKEKQVGSIMTPINDVFTLSSDDILDEKLIDTILAAGYSRVPVHVPDEPSNFIGMLLVRILISYDPEDAKPVSSFPLATLPETPSDTSCLNILNYFQEGKSHMVIVSDHPGEPYGAIGVLTLEDVIEELIGEEIIDESDVYVDVSKAIRRKHPGPLSKRYLEYMHSNESNNSIFDYSHSTHDKPSKESMSPPTCRTPLLESADGPRNSMTLSSTNSNLPLNSTSKLSNADKPISNKDKLNTSHYSPSQNDISQSQTQQPLGPQLSSGRSKVLAMFKRPPSQYEASSSQVAFHKLGPRNPAANPKQTSNSRVTIKRFDSPVPGNNLSQYARHSDNTPGIDNENLISLHSDDKNQDQIKVNNDDKVSLNKDSNAFNVNDPNITQFVSLGPDEEKDIAVIHRSESSALDAAFAQHNEKKHKNKIAETFKSDKNGSSSCSTEKNGKSPLKTVVYPDNTNENTETDNENDKVDHVRISIRNNEEKGYKTAEIKSSKLFNAISDSSELAAKSSNSTNSSLHSNGSKPLKTRSHRPSESTTDLGGIVENIINVHGVNKVIIENTSESDESVKEDDKGRSNTQNERQSSITSLIPTSSEKHKSSSKKKGKKHNKRGKK